MKKLILTLGIAIASYFSYGQNIFPMPSGNVGIGTNIPDTKLVLKATNADNLISFWNTLDVKKAYIGTAVTTGQMISGANISDLIVRAENQKILLSTDAGATAHMVVATTGNVGIGTTSPNLTVGATSLQIDGVSAGQGAFFNANGATGQQAQFRGYINGAFKGSLFYTSGQGVFCTNSLPIGLSTNSGGSNDVTLLTNGNFGIGTTSPDEKLTVKGKIHSQEVIVDAMTTVPDYVFEPEYKLTGLEEIKSYVDKNHHLPEIPSAKEIEKNGISLGAMNMKLLKKIEELTLYLIAQKEATDNQSKSHQEQINQLKKELTKLHKAKK